MLPDVSYAKNSFYNQYYLEAGDPDWKWLELIDRGRFSENLKTSKTYDEWVRIFLNTGYSVEEHSSLLSSRLIKIWDIGLRPLFPALHSMVKKLDKEDRYEAKQKWVADMLKFIEPLFNLEIQNKEKGTFHYFVLAK